MPDIMIKGMVLPNCCFDCPVFDDFCQERCGVTGTLMYGEIDFKRETLPDCPLVPLPERHGRLIDADALINELQNLFDKREKDAMFSGNRKASVTWNDAIYRIKAAPTIVPAEGVTNDV